MTADCLPQNAGAFSGQAESNRGHRNGGSEHPSAYVCGVRRGGGTHLRPEMKREQGAVYNCTAGIGWGAANRGALPGRDHVAPARGLDVRTLSSVGTENIAR